MVDALQALHVQQPAEREKENHLKEAAIFSCIPSFGIGWRSSVLVGQFALVRLLDFRTHMWRCGKRCSAHASRNNPAAQSTLGVPTATTNGHENNGITRTYNCVISQCSAKLAFRTREVLHSRSNASTHQIKQKDWIEIHSSWSLYQFVFISAFLLACMQTVASSFRDRARERVFMRSRTGKWYFRCQVILRRFRWVCALISKHDNWNARTHSTTASIFNTTNSQQKNSQTRSTEQNRRLRGRTNEVK